MTTNTKRDPKHVFVGLPQGQNSISREIRNLQAQLHDGAVDGYRFTFFEAQSYSTPKARNIIAHGAKKTDASIVLMIDSDMNPSPEHVARILARPERVIGSIYPKKVFCEKPEWVCHWLPEHCEQRDAAGVCECLEVGAGFLKIDMTVFDDLDRVVEKYYSDDHGSLFGEIVSQYFKEAVVTGKWGPGDAPWPRLLGEDFYFCWLCRNQAIPVHSHCGLQVGHIGQIDFLRAYKLLEDLTASTPDHGSNLAELPRHT